MAKDENVISLEERRRGAQDSTNELEPGESRQPAGEMNPVPGRLIWLHCPTCKTLEYTELPMTGGRVHNVCGTEVMEAEVELDLRAEYTIAEVNLERLKILEDLLGGQHRRYEEYKKRLSLAAGKSLKSYPPGEDTWKNLPVAEVDAFGLLISRFFQDPTSKFPDAAPPADSNSADSNSADSNSTDSIGPESTGPDTPED